MTAAGGGLEGGRATVDAGASSQFASAVLLVAPYARRPVTLTAERLGAAAYVELTAAVMRDFGAGVEPAGPDPRPARPPGGSSPAPTGRPTWRWSTTPAPPPTCSPWPRPPAGEVTVTNATPGTLQPDAALPGLLAGDGGDRDPRRRRR